MNLNSRFLPILVIAGLAAAWLVLNIFKTIPPGHVGVAALFGQVQIEPYAAGLHFPVNPLYRWYEFDARQKTHKEIANVPSQDQLQTKLEVSVQYRLIGAQAPNILKDTGTAEAAVAVHLIPKLRSLVREQGKSIKRAEDFFLEETQETLQTALEAGLRSYLEPEGIEVQAALIRDIQLPPFITKAIEAKKEREQAVEQQKAELERFRTEQQQKVALAEAERRAAEEEAARRRIIADAQAYEITEINKAINDQPGYIQLRAMDSLRSISKDPAAKIYFLNGDSPMPLPLMHIGDEIGGR
jgi:regulator of protease activity HflC (stomatin/prohibitin superfamily)